MGRQKALACVLAGCAVALFVFLLYGAASDAQGAIGLFLFLPVLVALLGAADRQARGTRGLRRLVRYGVIAPIGFFYLCAIGQAPFKPLGRVSDGYIAAVARIHEAFTGLTPYEGSRGTARIHKAALHNDVASIEKELGRGSPVDLLDGQGRTPLMLCAGASRAQQACEVLLRSGANPNYRSPSGWTPLLAALNSNLETVRLLVEAGADVNARDPEGRSPLRRLNERIRDAEKEGRQDLAAYLKPLADYLVAQGAKE